VRTRFHELSCLLVAFFIAFSIHPPIFGKHPSHTAVPSGSNSALAVVISPGLVFSQKSKPIDFSQTDSVSVSEQSADGVSPWPTSPPEEQGMDSTKLAAMLDFLHSDSRNIHSILIARHGKLVFSVYFPPFNRDDLHNLYSCTKSVTSAAVGMAIRDAFIKDVSTPAYTYFPNLILDDEAKKGITLKHLLTMSSGLEWSEPLRSGLSDTWSLNDSDSPETYFFSRPLAASPGSVFNYNTGGSHLLSMIVANSAGETSSNYIHSKLFQPLGINHFEWLKDATGHTLGGTGLALTSEDMLRFGQLYLQKGKWDGLPLLPADWVIESTRSQIPVQAGVNYGYQWWVRPNGIYNALGWGGQQIMVIPQKDMVVVFTAGIHDASWNTYDDLINTFILPSARSSFSLPPNPAGNSSLQIQLHTISHPKAMPPSELPASAREISGKTYVDLNGSHGWSTFTFYFDRSDEARLDLMYGEKSEEIKARIGLDGLFRVTDTTNYGPLALKGYWKDKTTFVLTQQFLKEAERISMTLTFTGNDVKRFSQWTVEDYNEESEAKLLN